jgi:hypothetical protein
MAGTADVIVRFIGDSSSLRNEASKVEGTGAKLKTWAKGIGVAIGAAFAVDQIKDWLGAASALQDSTAATEQIFGRAADSVKKFSEQASDAFGISKRAALEGANTFAAFGKNAGLQGQPLAKFSTKLVGLAGDLASFRGTSTEQAIEAVGAALRNEAEPIRAYGVLLDEGTLKARAMAMGLVHATADVTKVKSAQIAAVTAQRAYNEAVKDHGKNSEEASIAASKLELAQSKLQTATEGTVPDLTQQQKVLAAQAEIFAQTSDAQGDFERTSKSAANQQKALQANVENMQAALGTALLPALEKVLPVVQTLAKFFEENSGVLVPLTAALLGLAAAVWIVNAAMAANPVILIIAGVLALIAGIVLLWQHWDQVWGWIMAHKAYAAIIAWIFPVIGMIVALVGIVRWLWTNWDAIWSAIQDATGAVVGWIRARLDQLGAFLAPWVAIWRAEIGAVIAIFNGLKDAATSVYNWVSDKFSAIAGAISGAVGAISRAIGSVVNAIKGPINAVIHGWNAIEFKTPSVSVFGKTIGGETIGFPDIPTLQEGGYVARTGLALVHEGETFSGVGRSLANTYNVSVTVAPGTDPARAGRAIVELIQSYERANGRDWRTAVG